jgi:nitrogen regulatory protein P-II 1
MNYMVMLVLEDMSKLDDVLDALCDAGVSGATVIESTGLHRSRFKRVHVPLRFDFEQLGSILERSNYTLYAVVQDESLVERCIEAIEAVVGDFSAPNTGVLAAWPLPLVRGVPKLQAGLSTCAAKEEG